MSFSVALQSAIFYFCACTPCAKVRHHRKSKEEAKKAQEEKARLQAEMPHLYRHPDPFNTNPYWSEEIMMGPSLPPKSKGNGSKNASSRALNTAGTAETRSATGSSVAVGGGSQTADTHTDGSPTVVAEDQLSLKMSTSMSLSDDWNKKRYQREDEELWGRDEDLSNDLSRTGHRLMDAIKSAGSSAGRMLEATLGKEPRSITEQDRFNFYVKNPPVNDYHPPVVAARPAHKDAAKWMLQPPPAAKIMEGKVPVTRTTSQASRRTLLNDASQPGLSGSARPVSGRTNTVSSRGGSRSQRSTRSRSLSLESSEASDEFRKPRSRRARARPPITPEIESSEDEDYMMARSQDSLGFSTRAAQRPKLETIPSQHPEGTEKTSSGKTPLGDVSNNLTASKPLPEPVQTES